MASRPTKHSESQMPCFGKKTTEGSCAAMRGPTPGPFSASRATTELLVPKSNPQYIPMGSMEVKQQ